MQVGSWLDDNHFPDTPDTSPAVMAARQAAIREDVAPLGAGLGLPVVGGGAGW